MSRNPRRWVSLAAGWLRRRWVGLWARLWDRGASGFWSGWLSRCWNGRSGLSRRGRSGRLPLRLLHLEDRVVPNVTAAKAINVDEFKPDGTLSALGLTGAGYTVGVWDGYVLAGHQEFLTD